MLYKRSFTLMILCLFLSTLHATISYGAMPKIKDIEGKYATCEYIIVLEDKNNPWGMFSTTATQLDRVFLPNKNFLYINTFIGQEDAILSGSEQSIALLPHSLKPFSVFTRDPKTQLSSDSQNSSLLAYMNQVVKTVDINSKYKDGTQGQALVPKPASSELSPLFSAPMQISYTKNSTSIKGEKINIYSYKNGNYSQELRDGSVIHGKIEGVIFEREDTQQMLYMVTLTTATMKENGKEIPFYRLRVSQLDTGEELPYYMENSILLAYVEKIFTKMPPQDLANSSPREAPRWLTEAVITDDLRHLGASVLVERKTNFVCVSILAGLALKAAIGYAIIEVGEYFIEKGIDSAPVSSGTKDKMRIGAEIATTAITLKEKAIGTLTVKAGKYFMEEGIESAPVSSTTKNNLRIGTEIATTTVSFYIDNPFKSAEKVINEFKDGKPQALAKEIGSYLFDIGKFGSTVIAANNGQADTRDVKEAGFKLVPFFGDVLSTGMKVSELHRENDPFLFDDYNSILLDNKLEEEVGKIYSSGTSSGSGSTDSSGTGSDSSSDSTELLPPTGSTGLDFIDDLISRNISYIYSNLNGGSISGIDNGISTSYGGVALEVSFGTRTFYGNAFLTVYDDPTNAYKAHITTLNLSGDLVQQSLSGQVNQVQVNSDGNTYLYTPTANQLDIAFSGSSVEAITGNASATYDNGKDVSIDFTAKR